VEGDDDGEVLTLTIFRRPRGYCWCIATPGGVDYCDRGYVDEESAIEALWAHLRH
jgi:hypothetical protein